MKHKRYHKSHLLYRRPGSPYWYVVGLRLTTKTDDPELALEFAKKKLTDKWRLEQLGELPRKTWADLTEDWLAAKDHKRSLALDKQIIERFGTLLKLANVVYLDQVRSEHVRSYLLQTREATSASTANRHLNSLRAMFRRAERFEWIARAPRVEKFHAVDKEPSVLTDEQFKAVVQYLKPIDAQISWMALLTGLRLSNVCGLRWDWFDAELTTVTIPKVQTKARRTYVTVISAAARSILLDRKSKSSGPWVFDEIGRPRSQPAVTQGWIKAAKKARLGQFRFHDLRHTWASRHTRNGTPDRLLQTLGGWQTLDMLGRYAHYSLDYLKKFSENSSA